MARKPVTGPELVVRPFAPSDQPAVIALLMSSMGGGPAGVITEEFFHWKHVANPFGVSPGLVALDQDKIVGVRLFLRWELHAAGVRLRAVRAVDTATHPSFQGRGIFRRLTLDLLHQLEGAGEVELVFNTPNSSSRPGYLKMGWCEVGTLPVRLGVLRPIRFVTGVRTAAAATATATSAPTSSPTEVGRPLPPSPYESAERVMTEWGRQVDELIEESEKPAGFHTPQSANYLRWRYGQAPGLDYRCIVAESAGRLDGVAFGRLRRRGRLSELTLAEVIVRPGDHRAAGRLLRAARRSGADHVTLLTTTPELRHAARLTGFITAPGHGLGLTANPRRRLPLDPCEVDSWHLSLGDLEVF
jgi:GNAT superfamily N-acetyltransferase